ncbi:MAG: hypothetical protein C0411_12430 [Pseudomonas sp.]|nr:hypothetical protein [Pseudomonas sp.]
MCLWCGVLWMGCVTRAFVHTPIHGPDTLSLCNPPVGASLLAIAACQSPSMSTDRQLSRAGSLPQGDG